MSLFATARAVARHRRKTPAELATELDVATCNILALATENNEQQAALARLEGQLDRAGIELSGALDDLRTARREAARLTDALTATRAELANATAVSSLPNLDDTVPHGIDCRPVQQRFEAGPAIRLGTSPLAGHSPVPTWAITDDDTQHLPHTP
ncbi:MAG TPA: hypothetical protein DEQ61_08370 [Streptomyces sp.]|nr:hypothetical protein [Streptomyces sp.]